VIVDNGVPHRKVTSPSFKSVGGACGDAFGKKVALFFQNFDLCLLVTGYRFVMRLL
jgi:hypothetical protein